MARICGCDILFIFNKSWLIITIKGFDSDNSGLNSDSAECIDFALTEFVIEFGFNNLRSNLDLADSKNSILVSINCKPNYICKKSKALIIFCTDSTIQV